MVNLEPHSVTQRFQKEQQTIHFLQVRKIRALDFAQVCRQIAHKTTLTEGEVELFVLTEVAQMVVENIEDGRGTELGALGKVELSIEAESRKTSEELSLDTVKRMKLIFKPSPKIKEALKESLFRIKRDYNKKNEE